LKRVGLVVAGIALILGVVYLGLRSASDPRFVIWFGLASAILAPTAFFLFSLAWRSSDDRLFERLSRVPEIERLIGEARTQEERIALLEEERARLSEVIQVEARRQTLVARRDLLERSMGELISEYEAAGDELAVVETRVEDSPVLAEMKRMQQRINLRKQGRVAIIRVAGRELVFAESELGDSLMDVVFFDGLRLVESLQRRSRVADSEAES